MKVDVELAEKIPPEILYHGTVERNAESIKSRGLLKMKRLHVHLSADVETAKKVAGRRAGAAVVYKIFARQMYEAGYKFYQSENGVWLTEHVPPAFIVVSGK